MLAARPGTQADYQYDGTIETSPFRSFGEVSIELLKSLFPEIVPIPVIGTELAVNYLTVGVAADSANGIGRGGARNNASRESHALSLAQVGNLIAATRHAAAIGLPFNRMITIHWQAAGLPLNGMAKATGRYIDLLTKWLSRHGQRTAWLWVHENSDGRGEKGGHCHLLVHVPPDCVKTLTGLQKGWLRRIVARPYKARVIHSKPIGGRLGLETGNPDLHAMNLELALAYVLKGASSEAASQFVLDRLEPGGRVIGKRCGWSQNVGAKARAIVGTAA